jgi:hypothetical protein
MMVNSLTYRNWSRGVLHGTASSWDIVMRKNSAVGQQFLATMINQAESSGKVSAAVVLGVVPRYVATRGQGNLGCYQVRITLPGSNRHVE